MYNMHCIWQSDLRQRLIGGLDNIIYFWNSHLADMCSSSREQRLRCSLFCHSQSYSLWNILPLQFREPDISFNRFKTVFKTFLFYVTEIAALCDYSLRAPYMTPYIYAHLLTYLLLPNCVLL